MIRRPPRSTLFPYTRSSDLKSLAAAPLLDRIRTLDLSMGTLTDAGARALAQSGRLGRLETLDISDRKSTRLNSSHANISYAVFCLKKKIQSCRFSIISSELR